MRAIVLAVAVSVLIPIPAVAGGQVPPPRVPGGALPGVDEERLAELIDAAVERAMARRERERERPQPAAPIVQPAGQAPVYAAPQQPAYAVPPPRVRRQLVLAEAPPRIAYAPVVQRQSQYAQVLVPACAPRRAIAAVGARLVECGRPRVRTLELAPVAVSEVYEPAPLAPVYAAPQYAPVVRAAPQAPGK